MENEIKKLLVQYSDYFIEMFSFKCISEEVIQVRTPFLDRHSDYISFYVLKDSDKTFTFSDYGEIFDDIASSGEYLNEPDFEIIDKISSLGCVFFEGHITRQTDLDNFLVDMHYYIQALIVISFV